MRWTVVAMVGMLASGGCTPEPVCGNGEVEEGETCDDGGLSAACDLDCTVAECGDGVTNDLAGEECDGAGPDNASCDSCTMVCEADFDDCNGDVADGCEVSVCGGTCEAPGASRTFEYSGTIETLTLPACAATVTVEAWGAQGGGGPTVEGGKGARVAAEIGTDGGDTLRILVGGAGIDASNDGNQGGGSGGGGSFVVDDADEPWVVAGGGGGALYSLSGVGSTENMRELDGGPGQITARGQDGDGGGLGGADGNGGETWEWSGWHAGTGGGGLLTAGSAPSAGREAFGTPNQPGAAFVDGGAGGQGGNEGRSGGFGGGGAAGFTGGGGGGYSGGGSSTFGDTFSCDCPGANTYGGGGGGSFAAGTTLEVESGVREGDGLVEISWTP